MNSFASQTRPQKVLITVRVDQLETGIRPVQGALLWMVDLKRGLRNKRRRMSLQRPLHSCAPSEQERPRLGLCSKLPPTPFLSCPSELIVGITLGKLNCLQPCVQLYFTHMEWHLHILSFRNELIINQLFLN